MKSLENREDFVRCMFSVLDPLRPFYSEQKAQLKIGYTSAHYEEKSALMEGFSRPLWALSAYYAGGGKNMAWAQQYRQGLIAGTDPAGPEYWGRCHDYDQRFVEMAALAFSILAAPEQFWDPLTERQKNHFADWLNEINRHECCSCNWQFFRVLVNVALRKKQMPYSEEQLQESLAFIEDCYRGNGWYRDGVQGQSDYYVPFGMQYYGILYAMFMKEEDPERSREFIRRAELFGREFLYWFDENGSALPYGRSLTYRFAQSAFYSVCLAADIHPLPAAVMKGILVRNLQYWNRQPIFDHAGLLTIGYAYPNLTMAESYNAPGSPYWAMKTFACLCLPETDAFWKLPAAELPELEPLRLLEQADMLIQRVDGGTVAFPAGRRIPREHAHTEEKYGKFAYSTRFGFSVMHSQLSITEAAPDSMLSFVLFGHVFVRGMVQETQIERDKIISRWEPAEGIEVQTTLIPEKNGHRRIHKITSRYRCQAYDAGFAVPTEQAHGLYSRAESATEAGETVQIKADPNTNLLFSQTTIPAVRYQIEPGTQIIETYFCYGGKGE